MSALDRLLDEARGAAPDALDDEATDALVRAARHAAEAGDGDPPSTHLEGVIGDDPPAARLEGLVGDDPPAARLEGLVDGARRAEPDALDDLAVRRMADIAAVTGSARHRSWTLRRVMAASGVVALAAMVTLALLPRSPDVGPVAARQVSEASRVIEHSGETVEPTELELMTGDHIVAAGGARFHVEAPGSNERSVRLDSGAMLFDIRQIEGGRFSVATPNAGVVVVGTVFTVDASDRGTTVRVYEGRVELSGADGTRVVDAGGIAHLGEGEPIPDVLGARGEEAARARLALQDVQDVQDGVILEEAAPGSVLAHDERPRANSDERPRANSDEEASADAPPEVADAPRVTFLEARVWIGNGESERALSHARRATDVGDVDPWRMLEGDALRALGRLDEAADIYGRAARELNPPRRQQAGFLEARLRATDLADPAGALRALRDGDVTAPTSPLRERGLSLEAQVLERLGRHAELAELAALYLRDYPDGPRAGAMRTYLAK